MERVKKEEVHKNTACRRQRGTGFQEEGGPSRGRMMLDEAKKQGGTWKKPLTTSKGSLQEGEEKKKEILFLKKEKDKNLKKEDLSKREQKGNEGFQSGGKQDLLMKPKKNGKKKNE